MFYASREVGEADVGVGLVSWLPLRRDMKLDCSHHANIPRFYGNLPVLVDRISTSCLVFRVP